ncbi:MAG: V-type ATPase subunit [Candidatus Heimdallarchaeaceae archaeon]
MTQISPDIGFLTSYVRGLYSKLLTKENWEELINKPYEAFINELKSYDIGEKLKEKTTYESHEVEKLLTVSLLDQFSFILNNSPAKIKNFLEAYTTKFEGMNLQRIVRYLHSGSSIELRRVINLKPQEILGRTAFISNLLQCGNLSEFITNLKNTEYQKEIEIAENLYNKVSDIWPIEFALESFYLKQMLEQIKKLRGAHKQGATFFVSYEIYKNLLLIILKTDFLEIDVEETISVIPIPQEYPNKKYIEQMLKTKSFEEDLEIMKSFSSNKIIDGIKKYENDKMFLHLEIALRANELATLKKVFHEDFGLLSILCYLKMYEIQIQDLNKILYLKEYKFPIEKMRELIVNLV